MNEGIDGLKERYDAPVQPLAKEERTQECNELISGFATRAAELAAKMDSEEDFESVLTEIIAFNAELKTFVDGPIGKQIRYEDSVTQFVQQISGISTLAGISMGSQEKKTAIKAIFDSIKDNLDTLNNR